MSKAKRRAQARRRAEFVWEARCRFHGHLPFNGVIGDIYCGRCNLLLGFQEDET